MAKRKRKPSVRPRGVKRKGRTTSPAKSKRRLPDRPRKPRSASVSTKRAKAVKLLGKASLKAGPLTIGTTRFRGLSRKSFNALRKDLAVVREINRAGIKTVTYELRIRAPDGSTIFSGERIIIPDRAVREVKRLMRAEGLSETEAIKRILVKEIQRTVFVRVNESVFPAYKPGMGARGATRLYSGRKASRILKQAKDSHKAKGFTFSVRFNAEI